MAMDGPSATQTAVECLTLWLEPGDDARRYAARHIADLIHSDDGVGADRLIAGLLNLNMLLLAKVAEEEGVTDIAGRSTEILRELAPRLTE